MNEHQLLIRHAATWAEGKSRPLDTRVLAELLRLRGDHDDLPYGTWPPGSAERLLLTTWAAYGTSLPDVNVLGETLDTFWGFLRATGRMSASSASPAELRKEAKRHLPHMAAAYDDPARHSSGRVLEEFSAEIGISLDGAESIEELQQRLDDVQDAWNALPEEERKLRMPDPSPKGARGQAYTAMLHEALGGVGPGWPEEADDDYDVPDIDDIQPLKSGDLTISARQARAAVFVQDCLRLAAWVGEGREVTAAGLLRPTVAREAYRELDCWSWERRSEALSRQLRGAEPMELDDATDAVMAAAAEQAWRSAGECLALDRLWYPSVEAGLIEVRSRYARATGSLPGSEEEWRNLGLVLCIALCLRLGEYRTDPLDGFLLLPHVAQGPIPVDEARRWWDSRCPPALRNLDALGWQDRIDTLVFHLEDCGLWTMEDDRYDITDFGRDFAISYLNAIESGWLYDYWE